MRRTPTFNSLSLPDSRVVKIGHARDTDVESQGAWLRANPSPVLPRVHEIYSSSYVMEYLAAPQLHLLDHKRLLHAMVNSLETHIWSRTPVLPINHEMLQAELERLLEITEFGRFWVWVQKTHALIRWGKLHASLTHGAPLLENVMFRESSGDLVFIDPQPASLLSPDLRCRDVGRLLQSALGWEGVRHGPTFYFDVNVGDLRHHTNLLHDFDDNEWLASVFWCVVHMLRELPTLNDRLRRSIRDLITDALTLIR